MTVSPTTYINAVTSNGSLRVTKIENKDNKKVIYLIDRQGRKYKKIFNINPKKS